MVQLPKSLFKGAKLSVSEEVILDEALVRLFLGREGN